MRRFPMVARATRSIRPAIAIVVVSVFWAASLWASSPAPDVERFRYSGDGKIRLISEKNGRAFVGAFRNGSGQYDQTALDKICRLFDGRPGDPNATISLRLIEFLDYLQDNLKPDAQIAVVSGFRAPSYNTHLRQQGRLAAKASLHQYGMAADLKIKGLSSRTVWNYIKQLGFGGTGYYHGETVHIDVGPARSWDETTSGVGTDISNDNKLIGLVSDYDRYLPGERISLRFIRMTAFPIGIERAFVLERVDGVSPAMPVAVFEPDFREADRTACPRFSSIEAMANIVARLPETLSPGTYRVRALFCDRQWEAMPAQIATPEFLIAP